MNPVLLVAMSLLVPSFIALLALRYGEDSRSLHRSSEHTLALHGMRWDDAAAPSRIIHEPRIRLVGGGQASAYPILAKIDATRGTDMVPFSTDPQAARLEQCARHLADGYWSDSVWLTGLVPAASFRKVCDVLERERVAGTEPVALHPQAPNRVKIAFRSATAG